MKSVPDAPSSCCARSRSGHNSVLLGRVIILAAAIAGLWAQTQDIHERVRHLLAGSGEADLAADELANKNFARVQQILERAQVPGNAARGELLAVEGAVAFLGGKPRVSIEYFDRAAALAPLSDSDAFTRAMALVNLGDAEHASIALDQLGRKHPERALYIYWLGRIDYDQRRYQEAAAKLKQAVALDPKSARAWDSLGLAFDMQGQMEEALDAFRKAAKLNADQAHPSPWPPHDLGFLLLRMDRLQDAESLLRESLRYEPGMAQSHYHLGRTLEKQGKDTEAIREYEAAVSSDPASADACYSLALLYRKKHRNEEAEAMFREYKLRRQSAVPTASH